MKSWLVIAVGVLLAAVAGAVWAGCYKGDPPVQGPDPTQPAPIPRVTKCMGGPQSPDCLWPFGAIDPRNPYVGDAGTERNDR